MNIYIESNLFKKVLFDFFEAMINGFIISFTITIIDILPINIMFKLGVAFVMLMGLIYSLYMLYGRYLQKKWGKNNGI